MDGGYGIYAGAKRAVGDAARSARRRRSGSAARSGTPSSRAAGSTMAATRLRVPYVDETEIVMDMLRQGDQVKVIEPQSLIDAVRARLNAASAQY